MRQGGERCGGSEAASRAAERREVRRTCGGAHRPPRGERGGAGKAAVGNGARAPSPPPHLSLPSLSLPCRRARMGAAAPRTAFHTPPPAHSPCTASPVSPPKKKTAAPKKWRPCPPNNKKRRANAAAPPAARPNAFHAPARPRGKSRHHGTPLRQTPPPRNALSPQLSAIRRPTRPAAPQKAARRFPACSLARPPPKKDMKKGRLRRSFFPRMSVGFPSDYFR